MGEPIRIVDMARNLITMAGYVPDRDIDIVFTGLRPGEKLCEELLTEEEERSHQVRNRIMVAESPPPPHDLHERLRELRRLAEHGDREGLFSALKKVVPTYQRTPGQPLMTPTPAYDAAIEEAMSASVLQFRQASGAR